MKPNVLRGAAVLFFAALCWQGWTVHVRTDTWQATSIFALVGLIGAAVVFWLAQKEQEKQNAINLPLPPGPKKIQIRRFR